jgi:hypothetical protein
MIVSASSDIFSIVYCKTCDPRLSTQSAIDSSTLFISSEC